MKKLSQQIIEKISDFEIESDVSLPGFALEKDYFVLEAITLIQGPYSSGFTLASKKACVIALTTASQTFGSASKGISDASTFDNLP